MPELPEVETVRNVLLPIVKGRTITRIEVLRKSTIQGDVDTFIRSLTGQTFLDITRRGKFLIFHLSNNLVFLSHLRMEGKYFEYLESEENSKYARVVFHLDNHHKLCYDDSRCFGIMKLSDESSYLKEKEIDKLGKEPWEIDDVQYLLDKNKKSSLPIKSVLLDQSQITGLGNIYADEVLFKSKIHPMTPACKIKKKEWQTLVDNASTILKMAIKEGGSTIKSYHPGKNIDGNFQSLLLCYGKSGEPCPRCGRILHFNKVGGRGTTYCPNCQKIKKDKIIVGITGKIASGKSTVLDIVKFKGYPVLSSDQIVLELYQNNKVLRKKIEQNLNVSFESDYVDKNVLRHHLIDHPKDIRKLNALVHPLVIREIKKEISKVKDGLFFVEVPLLYESKSDKLCDFVIGVDVDKKSQLERLKKRNIGSSDELMVINANNKFDEYKSLCDFIIFNNGDKNDLEDKIKQIIDKLVTHLD